MKRATHILFILLCLQGTYSEAIADGIDDACGKIWKTKKDKRKCTEHVRLFEVPVSFMKLCQQNFSDSEDRWNCVKSGANESSFRQCKRMHWNIGNTLTCLRTFQNAVVADACKNFSTDEETQVACLRTGRESAQILACSEWSQLDGEKLDCLKMDIPAEEIRTCVKRTNSNVEAAKKCLLNYVAYREKVYKEEMTASTREILAREQFEQSKRNSSRMPASVVKSK